MSIIWALPRCMPTDLRTTGPGLSAATGRPHATSVFAAIPNANASPASAEDLQAKAEPSYFNIEDVRNGAQMIVERCKDDIMFILDDK